MPANTSREKKTNLLIQTRDKWDLKQCLQFQQFWLGSKLLWAGSQGHWVEDAPLRSFVASLIPRFFTSLKKKKEREKMATLCDVDRHSRGPGRQKSWRKTSGDTTRKCSKSWTVTFNNGWRGWQGLWRTRLRRVLQRRQTLNWDTANEMMRWRVENTLCYLSFSSAYWTLFTWFRTWVMSHFCLLWSKLVLQKKKNAWVWFPLKNKHFHE